MRFKNETTISMTYETFEKHMRESFENGKMHEFHNPTKSTLPPAKKKVTKKVTKKTTK